jgi:AMP-polyphosphate phosphotransferase
MKIDLSDFERDHDYVGDYDADLRALQIRLARIQTAYIARGKSAIIALESWDAAVKGDTLSLIVTGWNPLFFKAWPIAAASEVERARHFLWRFWMRIPSKGEITLFDSSWYGRVLVDRVEGLCSEAEWKRAYDEINEFESQQRENGVALIKIFLHITQEEQDRRLQARLESPLDRWKCSKDDFHNRERRADYLKAYHDMFERTDTRWAPWTVVDGNNLQAASIAILAAVADQLEKAVDMKPLPADPEVLALAEAAFGGQIYRDSVAYATD